MNQMAEARITFLQNAGGPELMGGTRFTIRYQQADMSAEVVVVAGPTDLTTGETAKVVVEVLSTTRDQPLTAPADCELADAAGTVVGRGRVTRVWTPGH